jgi:hypothetical protein
MLYLKPKPCRASDLVSLIPREMVRVWWVQSTEQGAQPTKRGTNEMKCEHHRSAPAHNPVHLCHDGLWIATVVEHVVANSHIDTVVRERELFSNSLKTQSAERVFEPCFSQLCREGIYCNAHRRRFEKVDDTRRSSSYFDYSSSRREALRELAVPIEEADLRRNTFATRAGCVVYGLVLDPEVKLGALC